jgi:2-aminobenzoate-CoA ligase
MTYDSFVRDRLPPPELLPEFRLDLPSCNIPSG